MKIDFDLIDTDTVAEAKQIIFAIHNIIDGDNFRAHLHRIEVRLSKCSPDEYVSSNFLDSLRLALIEAGRMSSIVENL